MSLYSRARGNMIEGQLRPNRVTDPRLLAAFAEMPREQFVPDQARSVAYVDEALDLGNGRFLLEPMVLARMFQEAMIKPGDIVLDVACGTGYGAAVLSRLASTVVAVEEVPALAYSAIANLQKCGADNAVVVTNRLAEGHSRQGPYDVIIIEGGIMTEPSSLLAQLADGGRLLAVEMTKGPVGQVRLWTRQQEGISSRILFDAGVAALPGFEARPAFVL